MKRCIYREKMGKLKNKLLLGGLSWVATLALVSVHRKKLREIELRSCLGVRFSVYWELGLYIHKFIICIMFQQYVNAEFIRLIRPHAVLWFH